MADNVLDVSGMNCPIPILKVKKALNELAPGDVLEVISTDPSTEGDFEIYAKQTGNDLLESSTDGDKFIFKFKKS